MVRARKSRFARLGWVATTFAASSLACASAQADPRPSAPAAPGSVTRTAKDLARWPWDAEDLKILRTQRPHVAELLERGETAAMAGHLPEALSLLELAKGEYPFSSVVNRRRCEVLTMLGQHEEAIKACLAARQANFASPLEIRALVRAFTTSRPTVDAKDLAHALMAANAEVQKRPLEMWGYADLCDIAERIGDESMLVHCSGQLLEVAPNDPSTKHALALLRPAWWVVACWVAIAAAVLGTAAHACWIGLRKWVRRPKVVAAAAGILLAATVSSAPARADELTAAAPSASASPGRPPKPTPEEIEKWRIDDANPESNVPSDGMKNRNPIQFGYWLQEVISRGLGASKRGDHEQAVKYFKALVLAVPDGATAYSRMCEEYEVLGRTNEAISSCAVALLQSGAAFRDYLRYVDLVLRRPGRLSAKDLATLNDVVDHVRADPEGGNVLAARLDCDIAVKVRDAARLKRCISVISESAANDPRTVTYQWSLAMIEHRFSDARDLIIRAKAARMTSEGLTQMEKETSAELRRWYLLQALTAIGVIALVALAGVFMVRRRRAGAPPLASHLTSAAS